MPKTPEQREKWNAYMRKYQQRKRDELNKLSEGGFKAIAPDLGSKPPSSRSKTPHIPTAEDASNTPTSTPTATLINAYGMVMDASWDEIRASNPQKSLILKRYHALRVIALQLFLSDATSVSTVLVPFELVRPTRKWLREFWEVVDKHPLMKVGELPPLESEKDKEWYLHQMSSDNVIWRTWIDAVYKVVMRRWDQR